MPYGIGLDNSDVNNGLVEDGTEWQNWHRNNQTNGKDGTICLTDNQRPKLFKGWLQKRLRIFRFQSLRDIPIPTSIFIHLWHHVTLKIFHQQQKHQQNQIHHTKTSQTAVPHLPWQGSLRESLPFLRSPAPAPLLSQMTYLYSTTLPSPGHPGHPGGSPVGHRWQNG